MNRKLVLALTTSLLSFGFALPFFYVDRNRIGVNASQSYPVHNFDTDLNYSSIQEAIDAPETQNGHYIIVQSGIYYENVVVNKGIALIGENMNTTVIDGNGDTVVSLESNGSRIKGFTIRNGHVGILLNPWTQDHIISDNIITENEYGISGHYDVTNVSIERNNIISNNVTGINMLFSNSVICDNLISDNGKGEFVEFSSGIQISVGVNSEVVYCLKNRVSGNTIRDNRIGIWAIRYSEENLLLHNNFVDNEKQISATSMTWNNNATENYWSDYNGADKDEDGIGDIPYTINSIIQDNSPLMGIFHSYNASSGCNVNVISNSTVNQFQYQDRTMEMIVHNMSIDQTCGFCRLSIPHSLLPPPYTVKINDSPVPYNTVFENETLTTIYFTYEHSAVTILLIPEFSSLFIQSVFFITTLFAAKHIINMNKRRLERRNAG